MIEESAEPVKSTVLPSQPINKDLASILSTVLIGATVWIENDKVSAVLAMLCPTVAYYSANLIKLSFRYIRLIARTSEGEYRLNKLIKKYEKELKKPGLSRERRAQIKGALEECYRKRDKHLLDNTDITFFE